ncbi:MAG: SusE domain-containing protein [Duncaniella sp.]|nr:SusE domain-containing protein [Duncaniella sp.]
MKKLYIFAAIAATALGFTACEDDKEPVYSQPTEFVLNTPPMSGQTYVLKAGDMVNFTCTQPNYGVSLITNYVLDVTTEAEFVEAAEATEDTPAVEANYKTLSPAVANVANFDIKAEDLSKALLQLAGIDGYSAYPKDGDPSYSDVKVRCRAFLTGIEGSEIASNVVTLAGVQVYNPFPAEPRFIYLVGNPSCNEAGQWVEPSAGNKSHYEPWGIEETGVGTDIYEGSLEIPAGEQYFRFYLGLEGWGGDNALPSIGPKGVDGENDPISFSSTPETYKAVPGKGSWFTPSTWEGGSVTFTLDMTKPDDWKLTVVTGAMVKENYVYLVGTPSMLGGNWVEPSASNASHYENWRLVDRGGTGIYTNTFDVPEGDVYFRVYGELTGWGATPYSADASGANISMTLGDAYEFVTGEGNWTFPWTGGELVFTLDTKAGTMIVTPAV